MGFPTAKTHPTKVLLAIIALHVVAATILLNAYVALWALRLKKIKNTLKKHIKSLINNS